MPRRVAILGGGVTGVVLAHELARRPGYAVTLFEHAPGLGGLHRSVRHDGLVFDLGAFLFSRHDGFFHSFPFLLDTFVPAGERMTVTPRGTVDRYPVTLRGFLRDQPLPVAVLALADSVGGRWRYRGRENVPAFAQYYLGGIAYRRTGLKAYVERFYGIPGEEIGIEFALERLKAITRFTPEAVLARTFSTARRSFMRRVRRNGARPPAPPAGFLVRGPQGFDVVYGWIQEALEARGVHVRTECRVESVRRSGGGFDLECERGVERYDRLVSTIPIPAMLRLLGEDPRARVRSRGLCSLFFTGRMAFPGGFVFNFTHRGAWKRTTIFSRLYGRRGGEDWFTVEATTDDGSPEDGERLARDFTGHAGDLGMASGLRFLGSVFTPQAYPLFRPGDREGLEAERDRLRSEGITLIGRQGRHAYISAYQAAREAILLARSIE